MLLEFDQTLFDEVTRAHERMRALAEGAPVDRPLTWFGALAMVSGWSYRLAHVRTGGADTYYVAVHPTNVCIAKALLGQRMAYLYWGSGPRTGLKRLLTSMILKRSRIVFVNDPAAGRDVQLLAGRDAEIVDYGFDAEFFVISDAPREDYIFCPGSNDRDPTVLLGLCAAGHKVVWLNNQDGAKEKYAPLHDNLEIVSFPSFEQLRTLYQHARCVVNPLSRDVHAAGQTTTLEALGCGTPIVVSRGRTSSIFEDVEQVFVCETLDPAEWVAAIGKASQWHHDLSDDDVRDLRNRAAERWHVLASAGRFFERLQPQAAGVVR
ncbi:glycosyltransferase [Blastomonas sp. SL216]|uniref:glycosyltransferase n=1 Tax=Blastomonas sp. SL216 TaxID=2995169 RepID=UPI002377B9A9|nr:glycosyltransferase [Blastomonas sp. SL216]